MDNQLFDRLTTSMQQMNEIDAGNLKPSRITEVTPSPHAAAPDNSPEQDADR
nr:hypothetical protein [uncultured Pantoea sp.]